ncbi:glutathione peroxidase [Mangrovibacillus cuniculi]|uniref:Glutathione peroxidase n=1 Tax=Mangrovibacillus cuniculi TaxID=2593652 RepID=A0A7S8HGV1_9BACI|nr:glutathione peroxidase [Mangrovibacillus cuniculi]QPC47810.1 glutathione peroxidase [Mangrovibacillus cuniculi]
MSTIYEYSANRLSGQEESLETYQGQVVLIVNTASKCGLTPQYKELQELYDQYKDQGFVVLGFPCDQFMNQEYDDANKIEEFCQMNYGVTFPMFDKVKVNGTETHPLFTFLKKELKGTLSSELKWNFTKFLVDRNGKPVKRYAPQTVPSKIEDDIKELL